MKDLIKSITFFSKNILSMHHFLFFVMVFISLLNVSSLIIFLIFFLTLFLVPIIGTEVKGAKRWLGFLGLNFQPVEFIKPFFVLLVAKILTSKNIKSLNLSYVLSFVILFIISILLIGQPDLGQTILLTVTWISLIFMSGVNIIFLIIFFISIIISFFILLYFAADKFGYIINRLSSFVDPGKTENFQSQKAIEAIRQGGLKGHGMGEGILKESVPEAHTDYIIAVISEEFGSIISVLIVSIFLFVAFRVIKKIVNSSNDFYRLSLCGLISMLTFQAFIHVGVNVNLLPTTGMTLPFLSYGGSSLLSSGIIAGIILNYTSVTEKK